MIWRTSDGTDSKPWRTRGVFDPNAPDNAAVSNLPTQGDCSIAPGESIAPYDSFIVGATFTYSGLLTGPTTVNPGDRLVYVGGGITVKTSWFTIYESYANAQGARIIGARYPSFIG
jgi:hypothetical protein